MSLSSVVSNLVRASMGTSVPGTVTDEDLDKHIAELILKEAKQKAARYSQDGVRALLSNRTDTNVPRANKRFLSSIIRSTDDHNKTILRAQALAAQESKRERDEIERKERMAMAEGAVAARKMALRRRIGDDDGWDVWNGRTADRKSERKKRKMRGWESDESREEGGSSSKRRHRSTSRDRRDRRRDKDHSSSSIRNSRKRHRSRSPSTLRDQSDQDDTTKSRRKRHREEEDSANSKRRKRIRSSSRRQDKDVSNSRRHHGSASRTPTGSDLDDNRPLTKEYSHSSPSDERETIGPAPPAIPERPAIPDEPTLSTPPPPDLPSKMDKYFEESYDPRLDVEPLAAPKVPATGLINNAEFEGWDAMLELIRVRREDKEDKKRMERLGLTTTKDRSKKGPSSISTGVNDRWSGEGVSIMDIAYTKKGSTREWDLGKDGI